MADEKQPEHFKQIAMVADGWLISQGYNPTDVYSFLKALEGAPEITNIRVESRKKYYGTPAIFAEYIGEG